MNEIKITVECPEIEAQLKRIADAMEGKKEKTAPKKKAKAEAPKAEPAAPVVPEVAPPEPEPIAPWTDPNASPQTAPAIEPTPAEVLSGDSEKDGQFGILHVDLAQEPATEPTPETPQKADPEPEAPDINKMKLIGRDIVQGGGMDALKALLDKFQLPNISAAPVSLNSDQFRALAAGLVKIKESL